MHVKSSLVCAVVLVTFAATGTAGTRHEPQGKIDAREEDRFRWSGEPSPFCTIYPRDAELSLRALRDMESRLGSKPFRIAVIDSEQCSGETKIGIAYKRSASSEVHARLFIFNEEGSLIRELGTE